jgi:uncharacterized protein (DUF1778 family)
MDLTPYVAQLREDLTTAASAGDDQTRRTAAVLSAALEPAARLAIMNALSDLAAEVTAALDDRIVEVRLDGRDVRVAVSGGDHPADEPEPEPEPEPQSASQSFSDATGDISRITLRLLDEIKAKAEQAANAQGVSLNTFVAQAVQGALNNAGRRGGHHGGRGGQWGPPGGWGRGGNPWDAGWGGRRGDDEGGSNRVRGWVQG